MKPAITSLGVLLEEATRYSGTVTSTTPITLMKQFTGAIADYLEYYVSFSSSFTGATNTTPPAPVNIPTVEMGMLNASGIRSIMPVCDDPKGGDGLVEWTNWMNNIYTGIRNTLVISTSLTTPISPTLAFPTLMLGWSRNDLGEKLKQGDNVYDIIGDFIINDLKLAQVTLFPSILTAPSATGTDTILNFNYL